MSIPSLYLALSFLIGYTFAATSMKDFYAIPFLYMLFFFLIPANIFLLGITDYFDKRTERTKSKMRMNIVNFALISLIFILPTLVILNRYALSILACFLLLATFYSAQPIRLKTIKFFDSAWNLLYILPGILGFAMIVPSAISFSKFLYLSCWAIGLYLFSAVATYDADKKAGSHTTASYLGRRTTLLLCLVLWFIFAVYATSVDNIFVFSFIYPSIPLYLLYHEEDKSTAIHQKLPLINVLFGISLFLYLYAVKFYL